MGYYKNISCVIEFLDRDTCTVQKLEALAHNTGLHTEVIPKTDVSLPGYTILKFSWSGITLMWSDKDLQGWILEFCDKARHLIGHEELYIDTN